MVFWLSCHLRGHVQDREGIVQVGVVEAVARVQGEIAEGVEGWELYVAVYLLVPQDIVEAGDEVSQVLVQSLLHTARHVGHNATSELRAVLLF